MRHSNDFSRVVAVAVEAEAERVCFRVYLTSRSDGTAEWIGCGIRGEPRLSIK